MNKKSRLGAPVELNYAVKHKGKLYALMIITIFIRYVERIPTIIDFIKRLNGDFVFKLNCGFLVSDKAPSEATYSRSLTKLSESNVLEKVQVTVVRQAIDDTVAIDATHFEARDQDPTKKEVKPKPETKKRGRKPKRERQH